MIEYENLLKVNKILLKNYRKLFINFWNSGQFILSRQVSNFEKNFSDYIGSSFSVGVNSGYDALYLSLKSLCLKKNSEVILPSNSYIAAVNAVVENNLKPVFVEPDIHTYNIDSSKIEKKITNKTKVILITHLYGRTCDMKLIMKLKKKYKLFLIEDCAQSHGSRYEEKCSGTFGDFGCFSFYPSKNLGGLGDGGMIATSSKFFYKKLLKIRNYGFIERNKAEIIGVNSRLDEFQAYFLNEKLKKLSFINSHKLKLAKVYNKYLSNKFIKPQLNNQYQNVFHIYPVRHKKRNKIMKLAYKKGVQISCHYPIPPHHQKSLRKIIKGSYPISEEIHKTIFSLPISIIHSIKDIKKICKIVNSCI